MRYPGGSLKHMTLPVKGWIQRFALVLFIGAALGLMIMGRADVRLIERLRVGMTDIATPVLDVLSRPVASVSEAIEYGRGLLALNAENARLREENARLRNWESVARRLGRENAAFRSLLNMADDPRLSFVTARVVADSSGVFVRTVLINAGARDGLRGGQAVITGDGLVGRIVETGEHSARVLLLTDLNARVPVVVEQSRVPAILAGDNSDRPRLSFIPVNATVSPGERIVTSGRGGMLPPGLPIGTVAAIEDGVVRVEPFVDWATLEYVRVLDYTLPGVLPSTRSAGRAGPLQ